MKPIKFSVICKQNNSDNIRSMGLKHRHLRKIDWLIVRTDWLVCLVSTVSCCRKNSLGKGSANSWRITKLEQSTFWYLWLKIYCLLYHFFVAPLNSLVFKNIVIVVKQKATAKTFCLFWNKQHFWKSWKLNDSLQVFEVGLKHTLVFAISFNHIFEKYCRRDN
jgi:hypothetical protein